MIRFEPGDILLLAFPYTAGTDTKKRPALVVIDTGDNYVVTARLTTQPPSSPFDIPVTRWKESGLLAPSVIRVHKLATIEKSLIARRLGRLEDPDRRAFRIAFEQAFNLG